MHVTRIYTGRQLARTSEQLSSENMPPLNIDVNPNEDIFTSLLVRLFMHSSHFLTAGLLRSSEIIIFKSQLSTHRRHSPLAERKILKKTPPKAKGEM
jgi:hypothetical protein